MRRYLHIFGITFALLLGNNAVVFCHASQNIPSQVQKVKDLVQKLGIAEDVAVILLTGKEYYGSITMIEMDSFAILEVDLKQRIAFDYKDVKKVRKGYGGRGFGGKRVNPRVNLIVGVAVIVGLITLVAISLPRT
jgi:hypothetical protein